MTGLFDTCMICGRRTRKPGEALCITHEIEALIALSYERMIERVRGNIPGRQKSAEKSTSQLSGFTEFDKSPRVRGIAQQAGKTLAKVKES